MVGPLISREDADALARESYALEAEGMTPIAAEQRAVQEALDQETRRGEDILRQIRAQRPAAYRQALDFWNKETIRKAGMVPPPLPRFVTGAAPVPGDEIAAAHNTHGGSTVNAVHGDLVGTNSYALSIFPDLTTPIPGKNVTAQQINEFAAKAQAAGVDTGSPNISVGTWYDAETDTTFLDISFTITNRETAIALGQRFNQKAIFDLNALEEIPTGGTGTALADLPSVAERLGILAPASYTFPSREGAAQATAAAPGPPVETAGGVPAGAEGVRPEVGGVQEEEVVSPPLGEGAQGIVNSLPEDQRAAAQKAFARDDRDPMADNERSEGRPVTKRKDKAIAPEKNTKLVAELSKYDFGKTTSEVAQGLVSDPAQPRWIRLIADLFLQLGLGENVTIRGVNSPDAAWKGLYVFNHQTGKAEILINLTHAKGPGFARLFLHELMHHGTLTKLEAADEDLTAAELAAKRELQKIFDYVRSNKEAFGEAAGEYGGTRSLIEFVSEIFANDKLRAKLNTIKPDGKTSVLQQIVDAIMRLLIGDRMVMMRPGSMLEAAIKETLNFAGPSPHRAEVSTRATAAMLDRSRAARLANAFPGLQEQIAVSVAPMAAADQNMGISEVDQIERVTAHDDPAVAFYTDEERAILEPMIDAQQKVSAGKKPEVINATKEELAQVKKRLEVYIKYVRGQNPPHAGWAHSEIDPTPTESSKKPSVILKRGEKTKANPQGQLIAIVDWQKSPYTYARSDDGKVIPRFLDRKGTIPNPEWAKRRRELGGKMYDEMLQMMERTDPRRHIILEQINWYRDMVAHLRTSFGSMSDYMADVLAGFSPQTGVKRNWIDMILYFEEVMRGRYDEIFAEFDKYIREDPENRTASTWKALGRPMPRKVANDALFGANTANAMMAGLDLWRAVKTGSAPKARNFGLNLIGLSVRATIDRWAARFLQRMHNPNWRLPALIEGEVTGAHMAGENVGLVSHDFGMGQDVFEDVATRLQGSVPEFKNLTPSDLQAVLWFAEKEYWELRDWTPIAGAQSSMNAMAEATSAQRYEAGVMPEGKVTASQKKMAAETMKFRVALHKDKTVIGGKIVPTVSIYKGKQQPTIDADWVTHPEYDPTQSISLLAKTAASLGKGAAHISRVIVNPDEVNPNATPGLHIFFKGRVSEKEIQPIVDQLKKAGLDGVIFSVDPRVRPEIIKSLDPKIDPNQYSGVRIQHIPQYGTTGEIDSNKLEEIFDEVAVLARRNASIADARVLNYDTLVLEKDTDYDTKGTLTQEFSAGRGKVWTQRALREGSEATARRDRAKLDIEDRQKRADDLQRRNEAEEQARLDELEAAARKQGTPDRANDGGIDPPSVAAMQYEDQQEPVRDPHGGRASLVRSMVNALTGASRDKGGIEVPQSESQVRGAADLGGGANPGRKGSASLWRPLGETFRKREASLYQKVESAAKLIRAANPEDSENPKDPARYQNSQALLDYLSGRQEPTDPDLKAEITELRKEIPTVSVMEFRGLRYLDSGAEASVYHDIDNGVVYKFYPIRDGALENSYVPGQIRLDRGRDIRIGMGERPTVTDLLSRMERANSHGTITPHELAAITHEGDLVFASPFVEGREVTQKNLPAALARVGVHFLSDLGATSGIAKLPDGRWVVYDDLHPGNVRTMPGGRVEIIDANNRELDAYEVADLTQLSKMPLDKPLGVAPSKVVSVAPMAEEDVKDDIDLSVAPMAGRGSRARWPWPWQERPEKVAGYKPGGMFSPQAQLSRPIGYALQEHKAEKGAIMAEAKYLIRGLEKAMKQGYGGKPTPAQLKEVQILLGNADNRLSQAEYQQALKEKDTTRREAFIRATHINNVAVFKARQQALRSSGSVPDVVLDAVDELRQKLDEQMQELLHDPGIDVDLKARLSADQGVFLHTNSYQHFENDVWGKYISKSNDPEAQRIRRAAEDLFKNEVAAEMAQEYQAAQKKLGVTVSDADALSYAYASGHIDTMAKTRLATYLRKDADEITRIHMLTGKMPVARSEGGKMLSLQRESIPKEVRELWGQWDEPKANFVKTYSLLANHNAENRMQTKVLLEGTAQGYIWKRGTATTPLPDDLILLGKPGDHGPLSDAYGPQLLKDGMSNYNHPAVQQLWTGLNRIALMAKTVGSIGSAIHNLLGNIAFTVTSGNLPWAVVYMPKGFFVTLMRGMDGVLPITPSKSLREEQIEMIRLGVFDSDVTFEQSQEIYGAMEVGAELEKKMGTAGGIYGALQWLQKKVAPGTVTARWIGRAGKNFYMAQDNFWKYVNYRTELSKQQWFNANNPTPPNEEEMKQRAARMVQDLLPNRERVSEWVRRGVGSESLAGQFVGPFFTFPLEAGRTVANNAYHTGRELFSPHTNAREKTFAAWRAGGMLLTLSAPVLISMISKWLNGYTDEDEEALRDSLPSYRQNASFLIMMPRDENGVPQYFDVSWLNPYGYYHSSLIAAGRSYQEKSASLPEAGQKWALNLLQPLYTTQPGLGTIMDMARNSDSLRGGAPVFNPEDSWDNISMKLAGRAVRGFAPGTTQNIYRTYLASEGYVEPKSGRALELGRELESLVGMPHLETLEMDKVIASSVGNYRKRMGNAMQLLNEKVGAKGTVRPGEITAAYERANEQAFEIFSEMNKAYENMRQLGMSKKEAVKAMEVGFGTEIRKGGLSKNSIQNIIRGKFFPIQISDQMEKEARRNGRWEEYRSVMREAEKRYVNQ